uniref:Uncharacterized protein n=1 Tax=Lactuca sativa TaxID=4236 RepID=A0A9R1VSY9_LACSA|nr:hypothetical protein LSAT_V11C400183510 [Lactuca sativa]
MHLLGAYLQRRIRSLDSFDGFYSYKSFILKSTTKVESQTLWLTILVGLSPPMTQLPFMMHFPKIIYFQQKLPHDKIKKEAKRYIWDDPYLWKYYADQMIRQCVEQHEVSSVLALFHSYACGGHFGPQRIA